MRHKLWALLALIALGGCGGGNNQIADRVEQNADNQADAIEASSGSTGNALEQGIGQDQANLVRAAGQERADAIRNSELEEDTLSPAQKNELIKGELGTGAQPQR